MSEPKIVFLDIETAPALAACWGTGQQYVAVHQIRRRVRMIGCGIKWRGEPKVRFIAEWQKGGRMAMLRVLHDALDRADVVVGYNSVAFDVRHIERELVEAGFPPPSPFGQIDLYRSIKKRFKFDSHKLGFISEVLEIGSKRKEDFSLWDGIDAGDSAARREMARYCAQDVKLTEELYDKIRPWIDSHPHLGVYAGDDKPRCPKCGSHAVQKRGIQHTNTGAYQRYQCSVCQSWSKSMKRESTTPLRIAK